MIKIEKIHITKFRGILDFPIELDGKSFVVSGPNGTGKSGVVDAVEFALTGDISRLSGKNRGSVSVKKHAPHVDYQNHPGDVKVQLAGIVAKTGEKFSITRSVEDVNNPEIEPKIASVLETLAELGRHRNSTLSRRELIEYVLSTPGNRAEQIQALLQLDFLRDTRQTLQKIARAHETTRKAFVKERTDASNDLAAALGIPTLKSEELLIQVNKRRETLELPPIESLEAQTSLKDGLSVATAKAKSTFSKSIALADLLSCSELLDAFSSTDSIKNVAILIDRINKLKESGEYEKGVEKQELLDRALRLVDEENCPVCETEWKPDDLVSLIKDKMSKLEGVVSEKRKLSGELEPVSTTCSTLEKSLRKAVNIGTSLDPKENVDHLEAASDHFLDSSKEIKKITDLDEVVAALEQMRSHDSAAKENLAKLRERVQALPDTSERDAARDFLVEVDVRLGRYREARRKEQKAIADAETTEIVFETFKNTYADGLNQIYVDIQDGFAKLYSEINKDDEASFAAEMPIQNAGLGLDVDFYGRGKFPPGAYHSEGHQDGMGLCLYLALMTHLYGENFQFCVLDDVLMSVDSGHRRAVCSMLGKEFPNTQFIFTTHDEVWLKNMQSTGLVGSESVVQFRNWNVDSGPTEWVPGDIWNEINQLVSSNDIAGASAKMRHYLEYIAGELCHELGASVVYRGDHRYALGQLLPNASARLGKLLKLAKTAATSWKDEDLQLEIKVREEDLKAKIAVTKCEEWGVNATVHYNDWATLSKEDFQPIVDAFKNLDAAVRCQSCGSILFVSPHVGTPESLRCKCAKVHINLVKQKASHS